MARFLSFHVSSDDAKYGSAHLPDALSLIPPNMQRRYGLRLTIFRHLNALEKLV